MDLCIDMFLVLCVVLRMCGGFVTEVMMCLVRDALCVYLGSTSLIPRLFRGNWQSIVLNLHIQIFSVITLEESE